MTHITKNKSCPIDADCVHYNPKQECPQLNRCVNDCYPKRMEKSEPRTVRDFVEELVLKGRTKEEILTVANNTYWKKSISEVEEILKEFSLILKKL